MNYILSIFLLLFVPAILVAQAPTRDRRSNDNDVQVNEGSTSRERVVGPKSANHAAGQKSAATTGAEPPAQKKSDAVWGNTSIIVRPTEVPRPSPVQTTGANKVVATALENKEVRKLVQPTSLIADSYRGGNNAVPATTAPALTTGRYNVGIGDVLDVRLVNVATRESTLFTVLKNGTLEYPLLSGPVAVAGLTTDEIANLLSKEIRVIRSARVTVNVRDYASHAVTITGAVDSPGRKTLRREAMPLYAVLSEAMVRPEATTARIVRNGKEGEALLLKNDQSMATLVQAGDIIKLQAETPNQFLYVGGEVAAPGEKVFRQGMTLTQALLAAGGVGRVQNTVIKVGRRNSDGFLSTNEYRLRSIEEGKIPDPVIQPGDRIEVTRSM